MSKILNSAYFAFTIEEALTKHPNYKIKIANIIQIFAFVVLFR